MSTIPRRCPSCGGACGYTKLGGCRYLGRATEVDRLQAVIDRLQAENARLQYAESWIRARSARHPTKRATPGTFDFGYARALEDALSAFQTVERKAALKGSGDG